MMARTVLISLVACAFLMFLAQGIELKRKGFPDPTKLCREKFPQYKDMPLTGQMEDGDIPGLVFHGCTYSCYLGANKTKIADKTAVPTGYTCLNITGRQTGKVTTMLCYNKLCQPDLKLETCLKEEGTALRFVSDITTGFCLALCERKDGSARSHLVPNGTPCRYKRGKVVNGCWNGDCPT